MASEVQICNRALQKLGSDSITSLADATEPARECNRAYFDVRDAELRDHNWNFAITRVQLAALATGPVWGFDKQFQLPADCLRVIEVNGLNDPGAWTVEGRMLLANAAAPLDVRYVKRETDAGLFDPLFAEALASRLAAELAEPLTQSNTKAGATVLFTVPFLFPANADLRVVLRDASNVETLQVLTTNYTVTGAGNPAGGSITMGVAPATGETLVIRRVVALTQGIDYTPNDPFPAETHEQGLDRGMMAAQQLDEALDRALSVPESDTAASLELPIDTARASKFLSFDATGKPIAAAGTSANLGPVSAFIDTLLDDADAGAARTTLGVVIGTDVQAALTVAQQAALNLSLFNHGSI